MNRKALTKLNEKSRGKLRDKPKLNSRGGFRLPPEASHRQKVKGKRLGSDRKEERERGQQSSVCGRKDGCQAAGARLAARETCGARGSSLQMEQKLHFEGGIEFWRV